MSPEDKINQALTEFLQYLLRKHSPEEALSAYCMEIFGPVFIPVRGNPQVIDLVAEDIHNHVDRATRAARKL